MKKFIIIAGPCLAESEEVVERTAEELARITHCLDVDFLFKASYKKANRSSIGTFTGVGDELALSWIAEAGRNHKLKTITDVHTEQEVELAAPFVDALQIPAFLARQTDLLLAAGRTGKIVNIKKGQFMAPDDMSKAADKVKSTGNNNVWLTERGTFFGYHDLVVDFRAMMIMQETGNPVIFDATHSVQRPSIGEQSGGSPQFIHKLARAAMAIGVDGLFFETHPEPSKAKSDSATQLPLAEAERFIHELLGIRELVSKL